MSALALLSAPEAQRLTQRIKLTASTVRDNLFKLRNLVDEAKNSNVWNVLGFTSWTAYLSDTLSEEPMRLGREERQQLVEYLSGEGLSTRAIAPIVGASVSTVKTDVQVANSGHLTDAPGNVTKLTGANSAAESYWSPEESFVGAHPLTGEVIEAPDSEPVKVITGLDGKSYPKPEPKPKAESKPSSELTLVNDIRLYLGALASSSAIASLTPAGKQHVINALKSTITALERN